MKDRVRELRGRLAPVLEVVSAQARRDIEELFELADRPANENTRLLREVRDALDLVERATGVKTEPRSRKRTRPSVKDAPAEAAPARVPETVELEMVLPGVVWIRDPVSDTPRSSTS